MLYSLKARAAVIAVMYVGIAVGALIGTLAAAVIQVPEFPILSGICMGAGIGGYLGFHVGERIGQKVDTW